MEPVSRVSGPGAAPRVAPTAAGAAFSVAAPAAPPPLLAANPVALEGLWTLQEDDGGPVQDRAARRRGRALLDALSALQRDTLSGAPPRLEELAALAADMPQAADPTLRAAVAAVVVRARIEMARPRPK